MGGSAPQSNWSFFLGNLLKPMGKPGNTWGHRKYSALKTLLAYAFGLFFGNKHMQTYINICKHDQARIAPTPKTWHYFHGTSMGLVRICSGWTVFGLHHPEMYALQGVPMTTLARSIPSIFQKWCVFRLPNPLKIHFSKKGIPQKKINIPGDPKKTKPVKCIKPPPQNKRSWGGLDIPTHGSYI